METFKADVDAESERAVLNGARSTEAAAGMGAKNVMEAEDDMGAAAGMEAENGMNVEAGTRETQPFSLLRMPADEHTYAESANPPSEEPMARTEATAAAPSDTPETAASRQY